jgi:hypothetical protein
MDHDLNQLPELAARYLRRAVGGREAGRPRVEMEMSGTIRLGSKWLPFEAREALEPLRAFRWDAEVRRGLLRIRGHDLYEDGRGEMNWRFFGRIPLLRASGPDIARSARGRCVGEAPFAPASLLPAHGVRWRAVDERIVAAEIPIEGVFEELFLEVDGDGRLWSAWFSRWGNPDSDRQWRLQPFGMVVEEEAEFEGFRIPGRVRAGWWFGEDRFDKGEFFRAEIAKARFG